MRHRLKAERVPGAVRAVLARLAEAGHAAWLVGGGVRDLLRSDHPRPAKDWDVASSARPQAVLALFPKVVPTGIDHGTVTVLTDDGPVEVTTFRGETGYTDARRPDQVEFLEDVDEDLARRDFTINALAWNPFTGELRDPFGGLSDLASGIVRAVRDPVERFTEDGLRPMRAVRFAAVLEFSLDEATRRAIPMTRASFRRVAVERIQQELEKLLVSDHPAIGLSLMAGTGLMADVLPEIDTGTEAFARVLDAVNRAPARLAVRLTLLLSATEAPAHLDPARILERLRFPKGLGETVARLYPFRDGAAYASVPSADLRRVLARVGPSAAEDLAAIWRAGSGEAGAAAASRLLAEAALAPPLSPRDLALSGEAVMQALGIGPGPEVGEALGYLLQIVLEDPAQNEAASLQRHLAAWWASRS
jgi:tRNA nucleotidyltransferase (CCA-adding enzyme)